MYTHEQKTNHLKPLYRMALRDGEVRRSESIFIQKVAEKLNVDLKVLDNVIDEPIDFVLPNREFKIYSLFHRLILIMLVDGKAANEEIEFCINMGVRMGLHPQAVNEIVRLLIKQGPMQTDSKAIVDIFKRFWN